MTTNHNEELCATLHLFSERWNFLPLKLVKMAAAGVVAQIKMYRQK